jgi:hypothetical protein
MIVFWVDHFRSFRATEPELARGEPKENRSQLL